jgi:hypothetical protein
MVGVNYLAGHKHVEETLFDEDENEADGMREAS